MKNLPKNCIADDNSNCDECELNDLLLCNFEKKFANGFLFGNIAYRILAIIILSLVGFLMGQWWMVITYLFVVLLTFVVIEPRLLCSHCPFYAKEGKCLKCWALRGMPKFWRYRPEPINKKEKNAMLAIGAFIDLFPYVGSILGIIWFIFNPTDNYLIGTWLIIVTIIFTGIVIYFSSILQGNACKKCPNFSCAMNKVHDNIKEAFMEKNPIIKEAWKNSEKI